MKLAEALLIRSELEIKLEELKERLSNNVMVQEGDEPTELPEDLLKEYDIALKEYKELIKKINKTNSLVKLKDDMTISEALTERNAILKKRSLLSEAIDSASVNQNRYSSSELKFIATVDVKNLQKMKDSLSKEYRELDTKIQGLNWTVDLI